MGILPYGYIADSLTTMKPYIRDVPDGEYPQWAPIARRYLAFVWGQSPARGMYLLLLLLCHGTNVGNASKGVLEAVEQAQAILAHRLVLIHYEHVFEETVDRLA